MAYTDLTASFVYKGPLLWKDLDALTENDAFFERNGWQDGDKTVFFQASAPTGWTKDTTAALDGKILRVVSGSGAATGGSTPIASGITLAHTHTIASQANHTHSVQHAHQVTTTPVTDATNTTPVTTVTVSGGLITTRGGVGALQSLQDFTASDSQTSGAAGSHDHGGATGSLLSNITLAYVDVVVCSKDSSSGYADNTDTFTYGLDLGDGAVHAILDSMGESDEFLRLRLIEATSVGVFGQANAPTGWTKLTTQNDKALRIVTGTGGGAGGSAGFGTTISLAHSAHSVTAGGTHSHTLAGHTHSLSQTGAGAGVAGSDWYFSGSGKMINGSGAGAVAVSRYSATTGSDASAVSTDSDHQHGLQSALSDVTLAYVDVVQCSKDSTPNAYTDMSAFFASGNLLAFQDLEAMADNDDYINYHQIPATSTMFFYMASAPDGWTKLTSQNDKGLRVVSSSGGGSGGSTGISSGITLAHTHTIDTYGHNHTVDAHTHTLTSTLTSPVTDSTNRGWLGTGGSSRTIGNIGGGNSQNGNAMTGDVGTLESQTVATDNHAHGGATGSALSSVTLAYADVIMCTKD
jgi:hypothetical protein